VDTKIAVPARPNRRGKSDGVSGHMAAAATFSPARSARSVLPETPPPRHTTGLAKNVVFSSADAAHPKDD
jgi:hypothetical protein